MFDKKTVSELKEDVEKLKTEKNDLKLQMKITKESCDNVLMFASSMNDKKCEVVHENDSNKKDQNSDDEQILEETERLKNEFKILMTSQNESIRNIHIDSILKRSGFIIEVNSVIYRIIIRLSRN